MAFRLSAADLAVILSAEDPEQVVQVGWIAARRVRQLIDQRECFLFRGRVIRRIRQSPRTQYSPDMQVGLSTPNAHVPQVFKGEGGSHVPELVLSLCRQLFRNLVRSVAGNEGVNGSVLGFDAPESLYIRLKVPHLRFDCSITAAD